MTEVEKPQGYENIERRISGRSLLPLGVGTAVFVAATLFLSLRNDKEAPINVTPYRPQEVAQSFSNPPAPLFREPVSNDAGFLDYGPKDTGIIPDAGLPQVVPEPLESPYTSAPTGNDLSSEYQSLFKERLGKKLDSWIGEYIKKGEIKTPISISYSVTLGQDISAVVTIADGANQIEDGKEAKIIKTLEAVLVSEFKTIGKERNGVVNYEGSINPRR